jgi:II/X family phage/plasmid replication protein
VIDWITLKVSREVVSEASWRVLEGRTGRVMKLSADGEIEWMMPSRESVRSDSHQVTVHAAGALVISGSPARVDGVNNVFGSGNLAQCAIRMICFVERICGIHLPLDLNLWKVTRVDVTHNYDLGSPAEVRQALMYLRHAEGGRYQVRTSSESVYWSANSRMRSGKAYHKGPHAAFQSKKGQAEYTSEEIGLAGRLLRLELALRSMWWAKVTQPWHCFTEEELDRVHADYFGQMIGKVEVIEMDNLLQQLERVAPSKGQALGAYRTWSLVKSIGQQEAEASMPRRTWYRHRKILFDAGLTWADLQASNVVPLRRRTIELGAPVRSWEELRRVA